MQHALAFCRSSVDIAAASGSPVPVFEMLGGVKTFARGWLDSPFPPLSPKQSTRLTRAMQTARCGHRPASTGSR